VLSSALLGLSPFGTTGMDSLFLLPREAVTIPAAQYQLSLDDVTRAKVTKGVLIGTAVLLLAVEAVIVIERSQEGGDPPPTISKIMKEWGRNYALLPYVSGTLAGHWWWNDDRWPNDRTARRRGIVLFSTTLLVFAWDVKAAKLGESRFESSIRRNPVLFLGLGIIAGHVLWPQKVSR